MWKWHVLVKDGDGAQHLVLVKAASPNVARYRALTQYPDGEATKVIRLEPIRDLPEPNVSRGLQL